MGGRYYQLPESLGKPITRQHDGSYRAGSLVFANPAEDVEWAERYLVEALRALEVQQSEASE